AVVRRRLDRRFGAVDRDEVLDDPHRPAGALAGDEIAPRAALVRLDAAGAPECLPVGLRRPDLRLRQGRLEGVDETGVGIDANPQLASRAGLVGPQLEPGF